MRKAAAATRLVPGAVLLGARPLLKLALRRALGARWAASVTAALGRPPTPAETARFFQSLADFHAYAALIMRAGLRGASIEGLEPPGDEAEDVLRQALEGGKGALLVFPHLTGYELGLGTLSEAFPVTVLARAAPDPAYQAEKEAWYRALGLTITWRARRGAKSLGEVTRFLRVLRDNRILAITPDLLSARGSGVPVRLFGREAELPAGPFFLAYRTGAPLLPAFLHYSERRCHVRVLPAIPVPEGDRDPVVASLGQEWATRFEAWVSERPDTWQFWLDKRWSRWLLDESRES